LETIRQREQLATDAAKKLYPTAPQPGHAPGLPLKAYAGKYTHPGYQTIIIKHTDEDLQVDLGPRTWPVTTRMEHVSGEFWILYLTDGQPKYELPLKVEFRLGVDGVKEVWIALEPEYPDTLFCFRKNE
jgi:hypothetical protein